MCTNIVNDLKKNQSSFFIQKPIFDDHKIIKDKNLQKQFENMEKLSIEFKETDLQNIT